MPADPDPFDGLPEGVAAMLHKYRPLLAARRHGPLIARLAAAVRPASKDDAGVLLGALSGLVLWAEETGLDVVPEVLLARDVIDRYAVVGLDEYPDSSRRHVRRDLDRVAAAAGVPVPPRAWGSVTGDEPAEEPYGPDGVDALLSWADGQPHERWRRSLLVLLAVGLGCGLTNADLRTVTGDDVVVHDDGMVTVRVGGDRAREVVCVRRFERLLASLAPEAAGGWLVDPLIVPRDQQTAVEVVHRARHGEGVPSLTPTHCRATWIAGRLAAGVRVDVLAQAAGLADAQDLLARRVLWLAPETEDAARASLRAAAHPPRLLRPPRPAPPPVRVPVVGPDAQAVLDRYLPRLADHRHAPVIRQVAAAAGPTGPRIGGFMAGAAADLVAWADRHGHPTGLPDVLQRSTVDGWASAPDGAGRWTPRTRRDRVGWIEKAVAVLAPAEALPPDDADGGPYTRDEIDALTGWADRQHDPAVRQPLVALLHTALGTGLRPEELKPLRGADATVDAATGTVLVGVRGTAGAPPHRAVPVLAEHEAHVRAAAARAGGGWLLDPTADGTATLAVIDIARSATRTSGVPVLTALRCRLTWLTAHLATGTRPDTLLRAAGLTSTANLHRYAAMLPSLPTGEVRRSLRGD